jgi:hypothetical protein
MEVRMELRIDGVTKQYKNKTISAPMRNRGAVAM